MSAWMTARTEVIEPSIGEHSGHIVKYTGDGFLAEFSSVQGAVDCALDMQRDLGASPLSFRMGISLGDVIDDGKDIHGEGVNIAARIEALSESGGICISGNVLDAVQNRVRAQFEDLGEKSVKNVSKPVRVYRILAIDDDLIRGSEPVPELDTTNALSPSDGFRSKPSVAVLPFTNMSNDPEQEYFSDGLTEEIITGLGRFHSIFVIARNSTFAFKGEAINVSELGNKLGAQYVVEGSVRKAGNRVRITVQLVDTGHGGQLWAKTFDRDLDDIFAVQDEVTSAVVSALPERVEASRLERMKLKQTGNRAAYDLMLHGREYHHKFTKDACIKGIELLEKAVKLDPNFAQAWAWLSCIYGQAWIRDYVQPKSECWKLCIGSAQRALEVDESDSECHRILSEIYLIQRKFDQAEYHNNRGLSLNPNDFRLVVQRGYLLAYLGEPDEGVDWINKVIALDPCNPENYYANLGITLHAAGRYQEAIDVFKRVPAPKVRECAYRASCHSHLDQHSEATEQIERLLEMEPESSLRSFSATLMYKQDSDREHVLEGVRKAGLPS